MNTRSFTTPKADLLYRRDRDAGRCSIYRLPHPFVLTVDTIGTSRVETLDADARWLAISRQLTPHEAERTIRKSATIAPQFKTVYLAMLQAGKEVK